MEQGNAFILVSRGHGRLLEVVVSSGAGKGNGKTAGREGIARVKGGRWNESGSSTTEAVAIAGG